MQLLISPPPSTVSHLFITSKTQADFFYTFISITFMFSAVKSVGILKDSESVMLYDKCEHLNLLWQADVGWLSDAHPAALSLSIGWGEKIRCKSLWVEIKAGRSLTSYCGGSNSLDLWKINLLTVKVE